LIDGLRVLQCVMNATEPTRVLDVANTLDIETTRAHRLLKTLSALGYLYQGKGRRYTSGPAVPILASQAIQASGFVEVALPELDDLFRRSGMLVAYGLFWERTVTYLYHARPGRRPERAVAGHRALPATRSRIGLAVLSRLDEAEVRELYAGHETEPFASVEELFVKLRKYREAGYAFDRGFASGGDCKDEQSLALTVPGNPYAAVAVGGAFPEGEFETRLAALRAVVNRIGGVD
jgi:DNA-binding IclR family transcriptional regulator